MKEFREIYEINVNNFVEKKEVSGVKLSYLSWANAWKVYKEEVDPQAKYKILRFENNLPYVYDENTGYMVSTEITSLGETYEMWLPVMDNNNKAMKKEPYTYATKKGEKRVEAATMFDVNKALWRCLVKNLGMFGFGLYIYAGEDLPNDDRDEEEEITTKEQALQYKLTFGKNSGRTIGELLNGNKVDKDYLNWLYQNGDAEIKRLLNIILQDNTEEEYQDPFANNN